jgi:serine/threonine protein kinase/tetratricopeptide (TPR) repeat protein
MNDESQHPIESPDGSLSRHETRIRLLLEEILETDMRPEQVSGGDLELERVLHKRLNRVHEVSAQMEAMFPTNTERGNPTRRLLIDSLRNDERVPEIAGYEVYDVIGAGGMGVVYRARHLKLNRLVAIKMLLLGAYASREDMECLRQEAQSVASLRHPNIVQVYDVDEHEGFPYYAMELLEGGDLAKTLQGKPRAAREAAELVRVLASAVHAAHLAGIVHRDLKPGNILLNVDETPKIGDFSLSRKVERDSTILTSLRQAGTPSYMAPEQAAGKSNAVQPAVDIYSLGAVLYELLTGRPPFTAETSAETRRQVIEEEPVPPSRLNSRVPRDLETICLKCLQKDPSRRYETAADLADDLERFIQGEPIHARPVGIVEQIFKWCRRRPSTTIAIAVSVLAMIGAVTGGIWLQRVENARQTEAVVRREAARASIESALPLFSQFVKSRQWSDAAGVLGTAQTKLSDADSLELDVRVAAALEQFEVAQELERIRQSFPEPDDTGYTFVPARDAYARILRRVGIGSDVGVEIAALRVRESPIREQLLIALDHAAFTERSGGDETELNRLLVVGRTAAPNPWQDRFRDPGTWGDLASLQRLVNEARNAEPPAPSHQMVMIGLLLRSLDANVPTIEILREVRLREPTHFWVNLELGHALRFDGKPAEALQFYQSAAVLQPTHFAAWTSIGRTLSSNGNPHEAIGPLRKAIALRPDYPLSRQILIHALARCGQWDEALATERDAVSTIPDIEMPPETKDVLHMCRARSAAAKREWTIAAESYDHAVAGFWANGSDTWFEFAAVSLLAGNVPEYRKICAAMLERSENPSLRKFLVARACTLAEVSEQELMLSIRVAMPELEQNTNSYWSLTQRAALLYREGKHREAIPILEQAVESSTKPEHSIVAWVWLSRVQLGLGDHDAARLWLAKATSYLDQSEAKPEEIHLHNWLEAQILRREVEAKLDR